MKTEKKKKKYPKSHSAAEEAIPSWLLQATPHGKKSCELCPPQSRPPWGQSLGPVPRGSCRPGSLLLPLLSISGCLPPATLRTECPQYSRVFPGHLFLPSWLGAMERKQSSACNPPQPHPNDHFHWSRFKTEDPWLSPASVTPKATTPSGGGIAGTQPHPRAVGRWAVLPSEMSHVPASGGRVAALLCPGGQSVEWCAIAWGPG